MYIRYALTALLCFFTMSVPSVFANTSVVSTDPVYAEGFYFYCTPYLSTFKAGQHYMPASNPGSSCVYSLPNTISGTYSVQLRRGTPTNSTIISGDTLSSSATLIRQSPNNIPANATNEEDFFAVVYATSLGSEFSDYLSSGGTPPEAAVQNDNYYILPWKWGPKPASEYDPLIIVPEILTTWQTADGTKVDPIYKQYQNLIDTYIANGYVLNQNLFLFSYDWRQSNVTIATQLKNFIASVKTTCGCSIVDTVGHGMGGTIVQQYIGSAEYANDIDQQIFLGTGMHGLPSTYQAWEGGLVRFGNTITDSLAQALINQEAKDAGHATTYAYVQAKPILSFKELLPGAFTSYLSPGPAPTNSFMDDLVPKINEMLDKVRVTVMIGNNNLDNTKESFTTTPSTNPPHWPDGQVIGTTLGAGDGVVPVSSTELLLSPDQYFTAQHHILPTTAQSAVFTTLNGKNPAPVVANNYPVSCVLFLTTSQPADMQVTDPNGKRLGKNFTASGTYAEIPNAFYSGLATPTEYAVVVNPMAGNYQVSTQGGGSGSFTINATEVCGSTIATSTVSSTTAPGRIVGFTLTQSPTGTIELVPLPTFVYTWEGFLQPINDTAHQIGQSLSVFKGGSTVPVKFVLKNAAGQIVQAATSPKWVAPQKLGPMTGAVTEPVYAEAASSGTDYAWTGGQYHYNWKTKGFATGYWYRIYAVLDDGQVVYTTIGLK